MTQYTQFTEENRWKDLIASDVPRFVKTIQLNSVDAKPPFEYLIKLFDNNTYDIVLQKFEMVDGKTEIKMYLSFKRDIRLHIATMSSGIWKINETNRFNDVATFGTICVKYDTNIRNGLQQLFKLPKESRTHLERYIYVLLNRTMKSYFKQKMIQTWNLF